MAPGQCSRDSRRLEGQGSIFQTNSDTEVLVHLIALSREQTLPDAIATRCRRVEGAFFAGHDQSRPHLRRPRSRGFRPLAMGRIPATTSEKKDTVVFASETCAFDLMGATYERDVQSRENWSSSGRKHPAAFLFRRLRRNRLQSLEPRLFFRVPTAWCLAVPSIKPRRHGSPARARSAGGCRYRRSRPRFRQHRGHPATPPKVVFPFAWPSSATITSDELLSSRNSRSATSASKLKLNAVRSLLEGKRVILVDDSIVRGTTSKKIVRMIRNRVRKKSTCGFPVRRRSRPVFTESIRLPRRNSMPPTDDCRDPRFHRRRLPGLSFA